MLWQLLLRDERVEGKAEGKAEGRAEGRAASILDLLEEMGEVPGELRERIMSENDVPTLSDWLKLAAKSESVEQFLQNM